MSRTTKCDERLSVKLQEPRDFAGLFDIERVLGQQVGEVNIVSTVGHTEHKALVNGTCTAEFNAQGECIRGRCLRQILRSAGVRQVSTCTHITS